MRTVQIRKPKYLVEKPRKNGRSAFYFQVPERIRPEGWPPTVRLSSDRTKAICEAEENFERMEAERSRPRRPHHHGSLPWLIRSYEQTRKFKDKAPKTKSSHDYCSRIVMEWSWRGNHPPIQKINRPAILKFLSSMDETPSKRNHVSSYLRTLLNYACDIGLIETNPAAGLRLTQPEASIRLWDIEQEFEPVVAWLEKRGRHQLATAMHIARSIGQREGDVLSLMEPRDYSNGKFSFYQSKTGAHVEFVVPGELIGRISSRPDGQLLLVANEKTGKKYNQRTLTKWIRKATRSLGLDDLQFRHLRHTCVAEMARAECTVPEIAAVTGHSLRTVGKILKHYLPRDSVVARNAISKLDAYREQELDTRVGRQLDTSAK